MTTMTVIEAFFLGILGACLFGEMVLMAAVVGWMIGNASCPRNYMD